MTEGQTTFQRFGEEIHAHQFLENQLRVLGLRNTEYILDDFSTELRSEYELSGDKCTPSRALCAQNAEYGQRPSVTNDITMFTNNIDCVQGRQQDRLVREEGASQCMEKQPDTVDTENIGSMDTGVLCPGASKYENNDNNILDLQAEGIRGSLTDHMNVFTQYEQQLQERDNVVPEKYDSVLDSDMAESRTAWSSNVGPGIAAKMKLLFNEEDDDERDRRDKEVSQEVNRVVMNREEEFVIKRRKRNGQRREEGVRVARLDGWLQSGGDGSRVLGKRKYFEGEVSENKRRMFGK